MSIHTIKFPYGTSPEPEKLAAVHIARMLASGVKQLTVFVNDEVGQIEVSTPLPAEEETLEDQPMPASEGDAA